jgi:hypothetical protein
MPRKASSARLRGQIELARRWKRELKKWQQSGSIKIFYIKSLIRKNSIKLL